MYDLMFVFKIKVDQFDFYLKNPLILPDIMKAM